MISKGLWKTESGVWFVYITKQIMKHIWEGIFYNIKGEKLMLGKWKDDGTYYLDCLPQYRLIERKRGEEKGWPNVPQM